MAVELGEHQGGPEPAAPALEEAAAGHDGALVVLVAGVGEREERPRVNQDAGAQGACSPP